MRPFLALLLVCVLGLATACSGPGDDMLILHGGHIVTLDEQGPAAATAVVLEGGRIRWVGEDQGALYHRSRGARVIDLEGATVVPGLADSHCHLYGLGKALAQIDLVGTASADECVVRVAAALPDVAGDSWLEGRGWDQNDWAVQEYPHRDLLDGVTGERPCVLRRVDGHAVWANTAALEAAGIGNATADPAGGQILRDTGGAPTGILIDNAADLVTDIIPEPEPAEKRRRILLAVDHCLAHGITGVHDAGLNWEEVSLYRELAESGALKLRYYGILDDKPETLEPGLAAGPVTAADGLMTVRAVKLYADGALGSRGAMLLEDYSDQPGHRGLPVTPRTHMDEVAHRAAAAGFQVCTHAIGDAANRLVLDIYEEVLDKLDLRDHRWRVEHAQILDPADIPRFAELGVIAAMQPVHCTSDMDWADERLGEDRLAGCYAWRSLLESGAQVCAGTDFPVERVSPLDGLYAARTRTHPDGTPLGGWQPQEILDGTTALAIYTAGSAYAAFAEHELGRVAPGFRADLTVLDGDPTTCPPADLLKMRVLMTVVDGRLVHERP